MPIWRSTEQILSPVKYGCIEPHEWITQDNPLGYPPMVLWKSNRPPKIEEIDIWEAIIEMSGPTGVYAAWSPYAELYIVTHKWQIIEEFSGWNANKRLENFLIAKNIQYPKAPDEPTPEFIQPTTIIV